MSSSAMTRPDVRVEVTADDDAPRPDGGDRYAIYSVDPQYVYEPGHSTANRRRLAETSLRGIGICIRTLREDGELTDDSRVGIFDREERDWLINPWARGTL